MRISKSGQMGSQGVSSVRNKFISDLGWIFREQSTDDYGIDAIVEIVEDNELKPAMVALQIKSGSSYLYEESADNIVFRTNKDHFLYWLKYPLPVIIAIYDSKEDIAYWEHINLKNVIEGEKTSKILIPKSNQIDSSNRLNLLRVAKIELTIEQQRTLDVLKIISETTRSDYSEKYAQVLKFLIDYPKNPFALLLKANTELSRNNYNDAINSYREALLYLPNNPIIYINIAMAYAAINDDEKALAYFNCGIKLDKFHHYGYTCRGEYLFSRKKFNDSIIDLNESIFLYKYNSLAYNIRGWCNMALNLPENSVSDFLEVIKLRPFSPDSYNNAGYAYEQAGELDNAIFYYKKALELDPEYKQAEININNINLKAKISNISSEIREDADNFMFYFERGIAYCDIGDYEKAKNDFFKVIEFNDTHVGAYINLGCVLTEQKKWIDALKYFNQAIDINPENAFAYYSRGFLFEVMGNLDTAIQDYSKAITINNQDYISLYRRAIIHKINIKFDEAIHDLDLVLSINSEFLDAINFRRTLLNIRNNIVRS